MPTSQKDSSTAVRLLHRHVDVVSNIRLAGAPQTLLVDEWALLSSEGNIPASLLTKLQVLALHEGMRVVVISAHRDALSEALCSVLHPTIAPSIQEVRVDSPSLAILAKHVTLPPHVYAWYVGTDSPGTSFHATRHTGARATDEILSLLGTAEVQERAALAFRAAGAGTDIPSEAPFDPKILDGITTAVTKHPRRIVQLEQRLRSGREFDLDQDTDRLIATALPPILNSQDKNGAVAAAPPPHGPNEPNYWFFWQRDAGQVAVAMAQLARDSPDADVRESARDFTARYVDFVQKLPHQPGTGTDDLGVSRFEMSGQPVKSYGNPQKDGPAHTVLAVTAALEESARAYTVTKPYLEYLNEHILGPSFDPWEFAVGDIFFDYNLARRALRTGARLARAQRDDAAAERYQARANEIEMALEAFKSPTGGYVLAGRNFLQPFIQTISHLDINVVGSVLTAYDIADPFLNVDDPLIHQSMKSLEHVYAEYWPVNVAWQKSGYVGMGMGRFPEDANDGIGSTGGNPWTFATLWAAQYYLRLVQRSHFLDTEDVDERQRAEWLEKADGYLRFVLSHVPPEALTEQIGGQTGAPRGAKKLAWAQAALIQTLLLRRNLTMTSRL